jgi:hypothetical protein
MNVRRVLIGLVTVVLAGAAELPPGFDPAAWPGKSPGPSSAFRKQLIEAQRLRDAAELKAVVAAMHKELGRYAGIPEVKPEYGAPIETSLPDLAKIEALCRQSFEKIQGRNGWEISRQAKAHGGAPQRLRTSFRSALSDLRAYEAGLQPVAEYRSVALAGLNYIASQQSSIGAFGYPYNPKAPAGSVAAGALAIVREGEKRGLKMTEGDWVIEDIDEGGLQFDNGEAGAGLLHAYSLTHDAKYLESARRAAEWAMGRKLVANWNYNSFSGWLLARLYRVTGEKKYLDGAIDKFEFGVLPGQWSNGRWVDQHNARPQYHAVMSRNLVEYCLALEQAKHPLAGEARRRTELALDSMAEEINTYGASNAEEGLPLEALSVGLMAFGSHPQWEKAANVYVNYLVNHLMPALLDARKACPETLTAYALWRQVQRHSARACEVAITDCLKSPAIN